MYSLAETPEYNYDIGAFIPLAARLLKELLQDYDPNLDLVVIRPERRTADTTHPWAVLHSPPSKSPYIVFTLREDELDDRVLSRIYRNDMRKHDVSAAREKDNAARRAWQNALRREKLEAALDPIIQSRRSLKHTNYTLPGGRRLV